jgi:hypothetical protein
MKLVPIEANTNHFRDKTVKSLESIIEMLKSGKIEVFLSQFINTDGELATLSYTAAAKGSALRNIGLLEYAKDVFLENLDDA